MDDIRGVSTRDRYHWTSHLSWALVPYVKCPTLSALGQADVIRFFLLERIRGSSYLFVLGYFSFSLSFLFFLITDRRTAELPDIVPGAVGANHSPPRAVAVSRKEQIHAKKQRRTNTSQTARPVFYSEAVPFNF